MSRSIGGRQGPDPEVLAAIGDWSALARLGLLESDPGLLRLAREVVVASYAKFLPRWEGVADFLERVAQDPLSLDLAEHLKAVGPIPPNDARTLALLALWPLALSQSVDTATAVAAAEAGARNAADLEDKRGQAFFLELAANRLGECGEKRGMAIHLRTAAGLLTDREDARLDRARVLLKLGALAFQRGRLGAARMSASRAVTILRSELGSRPGDMMARVALAQALTNLAHVRRHEGAMEAACNPAREAWELLRGSNAPADVRMKASNELAMALLSSGAASEAREVLDDALSLVASGEPSAVTSAGASILAVNLGLALERLGDVAAARRQHELAASGDRSLLTVQRAIALDNLARLDAIEGRTEQAQAVLLEALSVYRGLGSSNAREVLQAEVGVLNNLGVLARLRGARDDARDWTKQALERFLDAGPGAYLAERVVVWTNLGLLELEEAAAAVEGGALAVTTALNLSRGAFRAARRCAEEHRLRFVSPQGRRHVQSASVLAYELSVIACAEAWDFEREPGILHEAFEAAEAGRARNLADLLADAVPLPVSAPTDAVSAYRRARSALRVLDDRYVGRICAIAPMSGSSRSQGTPFWIGSLPGDRSEPSKNRSVTALRRTYASSLRRVQEFDSVFEPDGPRPSARFAELSRLLPRDCPTAFVVYAVGGGGGKALILTENGPEAVDLPGLASADLGSIYLDWARGYARAAASSSSNRSHYVRDFAIDHLPRLLAEVADRAVRPVARALAGRCVSRLVIVPTRELHLLPLAACQLDHEPTITSTCLSDRYEVLTVPSLAVLRHCLRPREAYEEHEKSGATLIACRSMLFALAKAAQVEGLLKGAGVPVNGLLARRDEASSRSVWSRIDGRCRVLHYCGHASFDRRRPLRSALRPSGRRSDVLTLREVFERMRFPRAELVVLSGCETGVVVPEAIDSAVGLSAGFLLAGARNVVSSLWAVDDASTALLMKKMYAEWLAGAAPALALGRAQAWLRRIPDGPSFCAMALSEDFVSPLEDRDLRINWEAYASDLASQHADSAPFASPYYWAPFVVSGFASGTHARDRV